MNFDHRTFQLQDKKYYSRNDSNSRNMVLDFRDTWGSKIYCVKMSPRCGSTLLKKLYMEHNHIPKGNLQQFLQRQRFNDLYKGQQYIEGSTKVAIKRDPIERWVSSVNIYKKWYGKRLGSMYHRGLKDDKIEKHVLNDYNFWKNVDPNDMILYISRSDSFMRKIGEFISQYASNGPVEKFDYVISLSELDDFLILLQEDCGIDITSTPESVNSATDEQVKDMEFITMDDLTEKSVNKLKTLYKLDFNNGWCE